MSEPISENTTPELNKLNPNVSASPTGTPVVPASWVPWLSAIVALAGGIALSPQYGIPLPPIAIGISGLVALVGGILLGTSPGLRK